MSVLLSEVDKTHAPHGEDACRAWLVSRPRPVVVTHSGAMQLKRLRVLARKIGRHIRSALTTIHHAIVAAKMRRVQRELMLHGHELRDFPQIPLIPGDKWDS